jgi:hypothetical protein
MRLPDRLYGAVKPLFASHGRWHAARVPVNRALRGPGTEFPELRALDEPGSGRQFLLYHREMLRTFSREARHADPAGGLTDWRTVPSWLVDFFSWSQPGFLEGALARTREIVRRGTAEELGGFLESNLVNRDPFRGFHNIAHRNIGAYEEHRFGADHPGLRDAQMESPYSAPHNEHFWALHAWIEDRHRDLLRNRGETDIEEELRSGGGGWSRANSGDLDGEPS